VIVIIRDPQKKVSSKSESHKDKIHGKMPIFSCSCGVKILVVPDLREMDKAIENHIVEHRTLSGQILTRDNLTQEILKVIIETINETSPFVE
jgi:hypothetical protein